MSDEAQSPLSPSLAASGDLVEDVYQITADFPAEERFGPTSQMRTAIFVPASIAEGCARQGTAELLRFLSVASGSLSELGTLLELAKRLEYAPKQESL